MVVAPVAYILPLCSLEQVREELADTENKIRRAHDRAVVSPERRAEYMAVLHRWRDRLKAQIEDMAERATTATEGTHHA